MGDKFLLIVAAVAALGGFLGWPKVSVNLLAGAFLFFLLSLLF